MQFFSYFIKMQKNYLHSFKIWMSILYTNKTYLFMSDRLNNVHLRSSIFYFKQRSVTSHFSEMPRSFFEPEPPPPLDQICLHPAILQEKHGSICQGLRLVEYSSNQTLHYIGVRKKKASSFCLQWTMCITQENEARNCNTSIRSQMILELWKICSLNLLCGQLIQTSFLSRSSGDLYRRVGDWLCI